VPATFPCSIVTPSEKVFEGEIAYASIPAWDGQQGVIHGRSPLLARLGFGTLRLDLAEGGSRWYLLEEGFAQVAGGALTVLTQKATPSENLDPAEAEAELAEARARVIAAGDQRTAVEKDQRRALAKKALARSRPDRR
jgi:F-type H+-transporting ATPase subunit epsilon